MLPGRPTQRPHCTSGCKYLETCKTGVYLLIFHQTHNLALATPVASFIVSIGLDGSVRTQGKDIENALHHDQQLAIEAKQDVEALEISNEEYTSAAKVPKAKPADGKLVVAEEISQGRVTWRSMKLFLGALGGDYPLVFFSLWMSGFLLTDWVNTFQTWFLGYWGSQYEHHPTSEVNVPQYVLTFPV